VLERNTSKLEAVKPPFPRISYDDAVKVLHEKGLPFEYGTDLGGTDETVLSDQYDRPVAVHRYPAAVKAFYMKPDPERPDLALCVDVLAPEGYGEIIGGGQRVDDYDLLLSRIKETLEKGKPVRSLSFTDEERKLMKEMNFLTEKKVIYVANVSEDMLGKPSACVDAVKQYAAKEGDQVAVICAKIEEEISKLNKDEKAEFLEGLGITESGLDVIAKECFTLLGLQTFLTTGPKETRAWTIHKGDTAPKAAGVIHTDFERGFIRANVVSYDDLVRLGNMKEVREKGLLRQEGKEYVMRDGDVVEFLFNV
jgi:hypothetical protein